MNLCKIDDAQDKSLTPEATYINDRACRLSVENLTVTAGTDAVVSDLSFKLKEGEILAIAGESGSGKSLTSLAIMGLLPKPATRLTSGAILLGTEDLCTYSERQMRYVRGKRIAMIFQEPMTSLNPIMTIGTQLIEAITAHTKISKKDSRKRAIEALKSVYIPEPERRLGQYPLELSGGMRQRIMIAMALALEPDVLIADEPTTALDVTIQAEILFILEEIRRKYNTSIILITHDMGVVAEVADRVIILRHGQLIEDNDVYSIFDSPKEPYTRELLAAVPVFRQAKKLHGVNKEPSSDKLLVVKNLSVHFKVNSGFLSKEKYRIHAVESISFDIKKNETFALVGESGCGKSTTARAIAGLAPHEGTIVFQGKNLGKLNRAERRNIRQDIQMVFQDPYASLDPRMSVGKLVREPLDIHAIGHPESRREQTAALFSRVGLSPDHMERYPHEFSGGQRQRICIARALALNPKLIIADESVSALDVSVQSDILILIKELQKEFGISYLFISHDMAVVEKIADKIAVMYGGQIVEMGTSAQVFYEPKHPYTKRLISSVPTPDPKRRGIVRPESAWEVKNPMFKLGHAPRINMLSDLGAGHLVAVHDE